MPHRERDPHSRGRAGASPRSTSGDVIHSLWVPELNRKIDMIPGRTNVVRFEATQPAPSGASAPSSAGSSTRTWRFVVVAEPPRGVRALARAQSKPAPPPADATLERGQQVFLGSACVVLPHDRGDERERQGRPRPHAPRQPRLRRRRRRSPNTPRQPRRLDPRSAAREARQPHAGHRPERRRSCKTFSTTWRACDDGDRRRRRAAAALVGGADAGSSRGSRPSTTSGSACATASRPRVFFLAGGVEAAVMRAQLASRTSTCSRPRRTTSCSRCTG